MMHQDNQQNERHFKEERQQLKHVVRKDHRFIYSIAGYVIGQSDNSESCHTQGVIIGLNSTYIFSLDVPPQNI